MNIAIIGAGSVGSALGKQIIEAGHTVRFGVREPGNPRYVGLGNSITTVQSAVADAEIVLLASPWNAAKDVVESISNWNGKILVDCTNPIAEDFSGLEIGQTDSGAEQIARWAKEAKVVKCFNQTGFENMEHPEFPIGRSVMFAAGDDEEAVQQVMDLAKQIGFDAVNAGPLHISRQLEQLAWLWIHLAVKQKIGRDFGFVLARH